MLVREWVGPGGGDFVCVQCDCCHKESIKRGTHAKRARIKSQHFCRACNNSLNKPRTRSPELRAKISASTKKAMASPELKARIAANQPDFSGCHNPFYGKRHSEESRQKIRKNNVFLGEINPWWKPWMSETRHSWGRQIRQAFNNRCASCNKTRVECKKQGLTLDSHHIVPVKCHPELRYDLNNGIAVCHTCHVNCHKLLKQDNETYQCLIQKLLLSRRSWQNTLISNQ